MFYLFEHGLEKEKEENLIWYKNLIFIKWRRKHYNVRACYTLLPVVKYEGDNCWETTGVLTGFVRRYNFLSFDDDPRDLFKCLYRFIIVGDDGSFIRSLPLINNLPARFDWSIIGWTIRRLALINLLEKDKKKCKNFFLLLCL